ncbi:MAG: HD-GYP domain-containing protein [Aquabacterium sp.]
MQFSPLSTVKHRVLVGQPLPFNVRDHDATLLLARGMVVQTFEQMDALFTRGALVDIAELRAVISPQAVKAAARHELPGLWTNSVEQVGSTLRAAGTETFRAALDEASAPVQALIERDPDLAIVQVLRQPGNAWVEYGIHHSTHCAIVSLLVAQRMGWPAEEAQRAFKAALTMNVAMLELQGQLAEQEAPPTDEQRQLIHEHPTRSVELLRLSGVTDEEWLTAVAQHHEVPDGSGYPAGITQIHDVASLVRRSDQYTAKLSPRATRDGMSADRAGRLMFMQDPGSPMTVALAKEFGLYPPGCFVTLASGERGVVVRRGRTVMSPIVAVFTNRHGHSLDQPQPRDTSSAAYAITGTMPVLQEVKAFDLCKLVALTGA